MGLGSYEYFADFLKQRCGLDLRCYKQTQMQRRIEQFIINHGFKSYFTFKESLDNNSELLASFMGHLTINVSQFFRDRAQWEMLKDTILPILIRRSGYLRIWSAGCSAGQEPYSLAIMLQEYFPAVNYSILATDIDDQVLFQAKEGIYRDTDVATPSFTPKMLEKYFKKIPEGYLVRERLKKNIRFLNRNLLLGPFDIGFDLIVCRNVVIYFTDKTKDLLFERFTQSLRSGGILFTGSTEHIFNLSELGLTAVGPFFYQKPNII